MNTQRVRRALRTMTEQAVPSSLDLWPGIQARAASRRPGRRPGRRPWTPVRQLGWAGVTLIVVLAASATVSASVSIMGALLRMDERLQAADPAALGRQVDLSYTIGSVTTTVRWIHAEPDRILIGYTLTSADRRRFDPGAIELRDSAGAVWPLQDGYGVVGHSDLLDISVPEGEGVYVSIFDNLSAAGAGPARLRLRLYAHELRLPGGEAGPALAGGAVQAQPAAPGDIIGPFEIEVELPRQG